MSVYDVAVVGLGAMGSAALYHLAVRGQRVIGLERATPGHSGGSSHGESRIIRTAYFEHPSYVPLLRRAYENWLALEWTTGAELMTITGILEAGVPGAAVVQGSLAAARLHDLPHEILSAREVGERFPAFTLPADWEAVFQPDAGFLRPERAIDTYIAAGMTAGAEVRANTLILSVAPTVGGVRLTTENGAVIDAGSVVVSAGAWIGELFPELKRHLRLTRQALGWFDPVQPALVTPDRFPVFLFESTDDIVYGFPDFAGTGVKAASHMHGLELPSADAARQDANAADAARISDALARFVPAAAGPVRTLKTCIYTNTPDQDFILGPHALFPQIVLASPCSGHGFKFASVIGEILADLAILGATPHDIARFRLDRFG
ncbi:MAG: N-methyltryptophan oxidase [Rhodospirillales bacterium]|nr:N-methyltryptophan oxidase [Rhodospirillales bacterium]